MPSDTVMLVGALIPIVAILICGLILIVPIAGLTLRFALKPALEAFAHARQSSERDELRVIQHRLSLVEEQLHALSAGHLADGDRPAALPGARRGERVGG